MRERGFFRALRGVEMVVRSEWVRRAPPAIAQAM
jgi:hypothetical protein